MKDVRIANDVAGACGADENQGNVVGDQGFEEREPGFAVCGGIFVGEVDEFDALLAMEAGEFGREFDRVAMTPLPPEAVLAAVVAMMRAAARELDDDGAAFAVVRVAAMIDEFPTDAIGVEIGNDGRGAGRSDSSDLSDWSDLSDRG